MKTTLSSLLMLLFTFFSYAQVDNQKRFQSDTRKYYVWNEEFQKYELKETEYEHSIIDIREIGSKTNGYIAISMLDNGLSRLHHGSILEFKQTSENEGTWIMKSKNNKAKITYNPKDNTMVYLFDDDKKRYNKLIIFTVAPDELLSQSLKTVVKND
jgi:hypothetical protein